MILSTCWDNAVVASIRAISNLAANAGPIGREKILKASERVGVVNTAEDSDAVQVLSRESDILWRRIRRRVPMVTRLISITVLAASERPAPDSLNGLAREYALAEYLDRNWALGPPELVQEHGPNYSDIRGPWRRVAQPASGKACGS
jgi:hypothetical protein